MAAGSACMMIDHAVVRALVPVPDLDLDPALVPESRYAIEPVHALGLVLARQRGIAPVPVPYPAAGMGTMGILGLFEAV